MDVGEGHPFVRDIHWMKLNGITTGNSDGTFWPTAPVSREAMAAFLYRVAGSPGFTPPTVSPFSDVPTSHRFYREITWMAAERISAGWPDGTFRPLAPVERQATAAFLYRLAGKPEFTPPAVSPFSDVPTTHQFYREITWMVSEGICGDCSGGAYWPSYAVARQTMANLLHGFDRKALLG